MSRAAQATALHELIGRDHFAADPGSSYTGVGDPLIRSRLDLQVDAAIEALSLAAAGNATNEQLLVVFRRHLLAVDRGSLDTEDAERVAVEFEKMLDILAIQSSDGLLNRWVYGFDPTTDPAAR